MNGCPWRSARGTRRIPRDAKAASTAVAAPLKPDRSLEKLGLVRGVAVGLAPVLMPNEMPTPSFARAI